MLLVESFITVSTSLWSEKWSRRQPSIGIIKKVEKCSLAIVSYFVCLFLYSRISRMSYFIGIPVSLC